jgi:hypothetical protein
MLTLSTTVWIDGTTVNIRRVNPGTNEHFSSDNQVEVRIGTAEPKLYDCADRDACYAASKVVALACYGRDRKSGEANATNSMVYEITNLIETIAGC